MRKNILPILVLLVSARPGLAIENQQAAVFVGQDLHMAGRAVISHQLSTGEHILVFRDGFSMSIGANEFSSDSAVVWLVPGSAGMAESAVRQGQKAGDGARIGYEAKVYLQGGLSAKKAKGARMTDLSETVLEQAGLW